MENLPAWDARKRKFMEIEYREPKERLMQVVEDYNFIGEEESDGEEDEDESDESDGEEDEDDA